MIGAAFSVRHARHEVLSFRLDQVMADRGSSILAFEKLERKTSKRKAGSLRVLKTTEVKVVVPSATTRRGQRPQNWRARDRRCKFTAVVYCTDAQRKS
jgi:hypothetical protein